MRCSASRSTRVLALFQALVMAGVGCRPSASLSPAAGVPEREIPNLIRVPGGAVNTAGGNLFIERVDMTIDTLFATQSVRAAYNSQRGEWIWNFQMSYDGFTFVDATGATHAMNAIADGSAIPGTSWVRHSADEVRTKGGWLYRFDSQSRISHARWMTIEYPRIDYRYDQSGGVDTLWIEQCTAPEVCTAFFEIALAADGSPVRVEDARSGRVTEYHYDAAQLVGVRDALAVAEGSPGIVYEYDSLWPGLLTAVVNAEGERVEYAYQADSRIWQVTQIGEGNPKHRFEFNSPSSYLDLFATIHTNPLGGRVRYAFDGSRRLRSVELLATGEKETLEWSGLRPSSKLAANGAATEFSYTNDDLTGIVMPSGNVVSIDYQHDALNLGNPNESPVANIHDSIGAVETRTYAEDGRVVTVTNGEGDTQTSSWAPITLASTINPSGATFDFPIYGVHGHWLEMSGDASDRRSFDSTGNLLIASTGRQLGGILARAYDPNRNVEQFGVAATRDGSVTSQDVIAIQRRSDGRPVYVARPGGGDHAFEYDALGRLSARKEFVDGAWQTTQFESDPAGNRTAITRPNGMREEYSYDAYGRVVSHRAMRDGAPEGQESFSYASGQVASRTDSLRGATEVYVYDPQGRLASISFGFGESVSVEYDLRSRVAAETLHWPGQGVIRRIEYVHDLADRIERVSADGGEMLVEWVYNDGEVVEIRYGNGLTRSISHDPVSSTMIEATTTNAAGQVVEATTVSTTAELDPVREQVRTQTQTPLAQSVERYSLTLGGNLAEPDGYVGQRVFGWDDEAGGARSYTYDELSNQVDNAAGDLFSYNAERNRLLSSTLIGAGVTLDYSYDAAGFATSRAGVPIGWTATGRMQSVGDDSITWDMRGRPISTCIGGEDVEFSYFGGRVANDPQSGDPLALDLGVVSVDFAAAGRVYRHFDFRRNVSFVSDESGTIVSHYQYSAYGLDAVFGADDDGVRFVGRQQVGELMWLGERIYDPLIGRFLSPDPVFDLVNQFSYTLGNPLRYWDPDGRQAGDMPSNAQVHTVLIGVALALGMAGALGCSACTIVSIGILIALFIDDHWRGGASRMPRLPDPQIDIGARTGSCGLLGIEPLAILAFAGRRRRRRRHALHRGKRC